MKHWRLLLWPGLATLVTLAILLALGAWQLQRMVEKEAMLGALDKAIAATPKTIEASVAGAFTILPPGSKALSPTALAELTRVTLTGTYIKGRSIPVRATLPSPKNNRSLGGLGFFWMTPLQLDTGPVVFINRGFVPVGPDYMAPAIETPEGPQTITGLIRQAEKPQTFTPKDNPEKGEYFTRDPKLMAGFVSLRDVAGYFVDAERGEADSLSPPVGVEAREMISRIPNNHLQYAVTWFGFALTLLGVFGFFAYGRIVAAHHQGNKTDV
jgi:surfeit locus 1 family protein